jgi:hypothetical protein
MYCAVPLRITALRRHSSRGDLASRGVPLASTALFCANSAKMAGVTNSPKRRWLRFSLRTALVLTTAICVWLAREAWLAREQADAIRKLQVTGGHIAFDFQLDDQENWKRDPEPFAPAWLRSAVGEDYFRDVVIVNLDEGSDPTDDDLAAVRRLTSLRQLTLYNRPRLTDACLQHISGLRDLRWLALNGTQITGTGLRYIKGLNRLEGFSADHAPITDEGLSHLQHLKSLRFLMLNHTNVTDAGMTYLSGLASLESLQLRQTSISDEGLKHLHPLKNLKTVLLPDARITEVGRAELQRALPNCRIN